MHVPEAPSPRKRAISVTSLLPSPHPYPPRKVYPRDEPGGPVLNALFAEDRPKFTPAYSALFPEYHATAIQTETVVRDMAPITTTIYDVPHGRNTRVIDGKTASCPLWLTEIGMVQKRPFSGNTRDLSADPDRSRVGGAGLRESLVAVLGLQFRENRVYPRSSSQ